MQCVRVNFNLICRMLTNENALFSSDASLKPFFFDGNLWFGLVDSSERLLELEEFYPNRKYLKARLFAGSGYYYPCFGFKGEGITLENYLDLQLVLVNY